jgi:hypothetical protein
MSIMKIEIPFQLSDDDLTADLKSRARREREATSHFIAGLAEFDRRRLYLVAGFPSMFAYCTEALFLSEDAAYNRIEVARTARAFPLILDMLEDGRLSLATVRAVAPRLTQGNHQELLAAASRKSRRQVEQLLAHRFPQPDVAPLIRKLPAPAMSLPDVVRPAAAIEAAVWTPAPPPEATRRPVVRPLSPDRYQIRFTASASTRDKLLEAQDLLRHAVPDGNPAEIIDRALTLLLKELKRKKFAATDRPRQSSGPAPGSRTIAAPVQRDVAKRDDERCAYVSDDGRRCNTRAYVQFHHVDPYGMGGEATVERTELRCRAHNEYEAELFYGRPARPANSSRDESSAALFGRPDRMNRSWHPTEFAWRARKAAFRTSTAVTASSSIGKAARFPDVAVPPWPKFLRGCLRYRESLDRELPDAPVADFEYAPGRATGRSGRSASRAR